MEKLSMTFAIIGISQFIQLSYFALIDDNLGLLAADKVCITKEFCVYDTEFGETTIAGGLNYAYDGIIGLAMSNSHPTIFGQISPFTQSVSSFFCN